MSIDNGEIIRRLRAIGTNFRGADSAEAGYRALCASAKVCSNCCQRWGIDCTCDCDGAPAEKASTS